MNSGKRTVLVTGGTGKLGRVMLDGFAGRGDLLVTTTRDADQAADLADRWLRLGASAVHLIQADLGSAHAARTVLDYLLAEDLTPEILVNNARDLQNVRPDQDGRLSREQWQGEYALGVITPYELSVGLAGAAHARLRSIVNIASMYGVTAANPNLYEDPERHSPINYGVVKAALIHLTRELAVRLAPTVRVNAVSFGGVEGRAAQAFVERYASLCPSGRMLREDEIFEPVRFLADNSSSGMTGHNLVVDGGWTVW